MTILIAVFIVVAAAIAGGAIGAYNHRHMLDQEQTCDDHMTLRHREIAQERAIGEVFPSSDIKTDWDYDPSGRYADTQKNLNKQIVRCAFAFSVLPLVWLTFRTLA